MVNRVTRVRQKRVLSMFVSLHVVLLIFPVAGFAQEVEDLPPGLPLLGPAQSCSSARSNATKPENSLAAKLAKAIDPALTGGATTPVSLRERMRIRRVPGVSIAVIRNGRLSWAQGFGIRDISTCDPVTTDTVFQAGSISKSLTAVLAMQAVDQGALSLDRNINDYLVRWKLTPAKGAPDTATVTLRQLLRHTAAISLPDSQGVRPGEPTYDIVQALRGEPPAKGQPVHIAGAPGEQWSYSNGGYLVVQLALEDSLKTPFGKLAQQRVLAPLAMDLSSFDQPPAQPDRASGHHIGKPFVDKAYDVPELAAGGLWSTPTDLAHFLIAIRDAVKGTDNRILPQKLATMMIEPGMGNWGLGFSIDGSRFGHDGARWGMMSRMWIDSDTGDGIVVMSNGEEGLQLATEIIRTAANLYGWKGLQSRSFNQARDSGPIFLRGTMNDWDTQAEMHPTGRNHYAVTLNIPAGPQSFKVASEDWSTFVLGASGSPQLIKANSLDAEGPDIRIDFPIAGRYRFSLHAPDSGIASLIVKPVSD
jgi:CubicO group peptidase (beta-lactamase class C family)